jgi:hypothetical protein
LVLHGAFVWARRALKSQKRWFPVRAEDCELVIGHVTMGGSKAEGLLRMYGHFGAEAVTTTAAGTTPATQQRLRVEIASWDDAKLAAIAAGGGARLFQALLLVLAVLLTLLAWVVGKWIPRPNKNDSAPLPRLGL